jgi:hypothetical protein
VTPPKISDDPKAPFGYDEDGHVIAPFGLKADGNPRTSNRGRRPGDGFGAAPKKTAPAPKKKPAPTPAEKPAADRRGQLDYRVVAGGLVALAAIPFQVAGSDPGGFLGRLIGEKQVTALRGDAAIISMFAQPLGNALGGVASVNPWLAAKLEGGNLPKEYVVLAVTASQMVSALVGNHRDPSPQLAEMAQEMAAVQAAEIKRNIDALRQQEEEQPTAGPFDETGAAVDLEEQEEEQPAPGVPPMPGYAPGPGQRDEYGTEPFAYSVAS